MRARIAARVAGGSVTEPRVIRDRDRDWDRYRDGGVGNRDGGAETEVVRAVDLRSFPQMEDEPGDGDAG